jgi:hypothetical protein
VSPTATFPLSPSSRGIGPAGIAAVGGLALMAGGALGATGGNPAVPAAFMALVLVASVAAFPFVAAYVWLALGPLIVGIARGEGLMVLRPNEGLLFLLVAGVALRFGWQALRGSLVLPRPRRLDVAMLLLVLTGSVAPLLVRYGRGLEVSTDDVLYSFVFIKYLLLYALFRLTIRSERQVATSLKLILATGAVVSAIGLFQVSGRFGVAEFLGRYYDAPFEGSSGASLLRGSSTLASSFGLADMAAMCVAVFLAWLAEENRRLVWLLPAGALCVGGCIAAGSFSGVIGLAVVFVTVGLVTGRVLTFAAVAVPAFAVGLAAVWPVVAARLEGFDSYQGLPHSWIGRLDNLERFFWPEVTSGINWLVGVRPAARVAAPEHWREWVYIESGHTWFLWVGGLPLLLAFLWFTWVLLRDTSPPEAGSSSSARIARRAAFAATLMIFVLTLFDPHLTVRGTADLFFPLIALALVSVRSAPLRGPANERRR